MIFEAGVVALFVCLVGIAVTCITARLAALRAAAEQREAQRWAVVRGVQLLYLARTSKKHSGDLPVSGTAAVPRLSVEVQK
jgi:hypothetical protein